MMQDPSISPMFKSSLPFPLFPCDIAGSLLNLDQETQVKNALVIKKQINTVFTWACDICPFGLVKFTPYTAHFGVLLPSDVHSTYHSQ
jgi:hypothetical protein